MRILSNSARERSGRGGEHRPNSLNEALPVAQRYPELFEIAFCQLRQHIAVDRVLDEQRLIAFETEVSQPAANVHGSALIRSRLIIIFVTKRVQYIFGLKLIQFRGVQRGNIFALVEPGARMNERSSWGRLTTVIS